MMKLKHLTLLTILSQLSLASSIYYDVKTKLTISDEKEQVKLSFEDGKKYCEDLTLDGFDDWVLPSISQMVIFEDRSNTKSFVNKELKNYKRYDYWSSTPDAMV